MTQDHNNDSRGLIVDDDPALDFILYKETTKDDQGQQGGRGGCFGIICTTFITVDEHGAILSEMIAASVIGDNSTVNTCGILVGACCLLRGIIELDW
jgi:hypothetical protein